MNEIKLSSRVSKQIVTAGIPGGILAALLLLSTGVQASLIGLQDKIENPTDSGTGPAIWYKTSAGTNSGSGDAELTAAGLSGTRTDFFDNAANAFAVGVGASKGVEIAGSTATSYATGAQGTLVMTFQTGGTIYGASLLNRGPWHSTNPGFEVYQTNTKIRLGFGSNTTEIGDSLALNTWYYLAMTWDTALPNNQVSWYLGKMGDAPDGLTSGTITAATVGNNTLPIYVAGRDSSAVFYGALQNVAIYDRTLSSDAIGAQFSAIPEPATLGMLGVSMVILCAFRRICY